MKKTGIFIFSLILVYNSCSGQQGDASDSKSAFYNPDFEITFFSNAENVDAIERNTLAANLIEKSYAVEGTLKDSILNEAKNILEDVIRNNELFYKAYVNLATVFIKKRNFDKAELILKKLNDKIEYPYAVFYLGILLEKKGKIKQAKEKYKRALYLYNEYLKTYMSSINDELSREYVLLLLEGKEEAAKRLNDQFANSENLPILSKEDIKSFDRDKFINDF